MDELIVLDTCPLPTGSHPGVSSPPLARSLEFLYTSNLPQLHYFQPVKRVELTHSQKVYLKGSKSAIYSLSRNGKEIFLLLVTSGYKDMFVNFICHLKEIPSYGSHGDRQGAGGGMGMFLVLTPHEDIASVADSFGVETILLEPGDLSTSSHIFNTTTEFEANVNANFGSLLYQELIYQRTRTALLLLQLGYSVIIIDIDTVWLSDPLLALDKLRNKSHDMYVVYDSPTELCGCFIYLNATSQAIAFWQEVTKQHYDLILKNEKMYLESVRQNEMNGGVGKSWSSAMDLITESEQVILTALLLDKQYKKSIDYFILNGLSQRDSSHLNLFPSGMDYFVMKRHLKGNTDDNLASNVVVIHNNFLIGYNAKRSRFMYHNLWRVATFSSTENASYMPTCLNQNPHMHTPVENGALQSDDMLSLWRTCCFEDVIKNNSISSLLISLPVHNSILRDNRMQTIAMYEHPTGRNAPSTGKLYVQRNPLAFVAFDQYVLLDIDNRRVHHKLQSVVVEMDDSNLIEYVDVLVLSGGDLKLEEQAATEIFAIDRGGSFHCDADYNALHLCCKDEVLFSHYLSLLCSEVHNGSMPRLLALKESDFPPLVTVDNFKFMDLLIPMTFSSDVRWWIADFNSHLGNDDLKLSSSTHISSQKASLSYSLRVITFNRPHSLARLLNSLSHARYVTNSTYDLYLYVDKCPLTGHKDCVSYRQYIFIIYSFLF